MQADAAVARSLAAPAVRGGTKAIRFRSIFGQPSPAALACFQRCRSPAGGVTGSTMLAAWLVAG